MRNLKLLDYLGLVRNQDGLFDDLVDDPQLRQITKIEKDNEKTRHFVEQERPRLLLPLPEALH